MTTENLGERICVSKACVCFSYSSALEPTGLSLYFFFLFVSNDDDEQHPWNMPCVPSASLIVTQKDRCWVLLQSLIDTVHLHTKLWFGFRTLVMEVTTADEKRKNDLQPCSRKLQRVPLLIPLPDQKITRVKIDFFIFCRQHSEEAPSRKLQL